LEIMTRRMAKTTLTRNSKKLDDFALVWKIMDAYDNDLSVNVCSFSCCDLGIWKRAALRNRKHKPSV
jgi:hypothetical protein